MIVGDGIVGEGNADRRLVLNRTVSDSIFTRVTYSTSVGEPIPFGYSDCESNPAGYARLIAGDLEENVKDYVIAGGRAVVEGNADTHISVLNRTDGDIPLTFGEPLTFRSIIQPRPAQGLARPWFKGHYTIFLMEHLTRCDIVKVYGDVRCSIYFGIFPLKFNLVHGRDHFVESLKKFEKIGLIGKDWVNGNQKKCLLCS